jgi:pimeloyl-ACP methyl ester carboxylesterase
MTRTVVLVCGASAVAAMEAGEREEVTAMSGTDELRAVTRIVSAAAYRATHGQKHDEKPAVRPRTRKLQKPRKAQPLGPRFGDALRAAGARVAALEQAALRTPDGVLRYVDIGAGAPVLLVHGIFGGADAALRQLAPLVPGGFRVIAPSRFGYLGSALPAGASPARQADVFAALLDKLGIEKTAVVAASAGATSALQLAIRHPERVSALVLVSPNGPGCQHDRTPMSRVVASALWRSERLMWLARRRFTARLSHMMGVRGDLPLRYADRDRVDAELDGIFPVAERVDGALFDAFVSNPDINHGYEYGRITAPTLVVHARDDALVPCWAAVALAQSIPGARLHVLEDGGGHLMLGEHPEVAAEIGALLRSTQD